jgi:chaperonin GroES
LTIIGSIIKLTVVKITDIKNKQRRFKMTLKPLGDRVLIEIKASEEKTSGGIVIPQTAQEKTQEGKVISVGPGKMDDKGVKHALDVKVGDKVIYDKYAGTQYKMGDKDFLLIKADEILAIVE